MADRASHARHDRFAVAESVGGGALPASIGSCPACGALHGDLLTIRAALRHAWVPIRPRDLHLTVSDAARLRPGRWWRRAIAAVGTSRDAVTRPLGLTFTALGLAGLLLAAVPIGSSGASTASASPAPAEQHVLVQGGPDPSSGHDERQASPAEDEPLAVLSVGLLAAGGALFGLRRLAPRARAMR